MTWSKTTRVQSQSTHGGDRNRAANRQAWHCTQAQLYGELDLALSWSERELPERERTKHVHRLHPYLGKFVPQLVEALLERYVRPGGRVLDPFAGSGTTLVQALESGYDAVGVDIAAFNALLISVKTREHDLELARRRACATRRAARRFGRAADGLRPRVVRAAGGRRAAPLPLARSPEYASQDVLRVVLARAARSARLTTHFDLDFPRAPQRGEYWCHKHRRTCRPVESANKFLTRYLADTAARIGAFADVRDPRRAAVVLHGDARELELGGPYDGVVTSPPYPGLIDYHEQHRYAYELLGLDDRRERELGAAARGTSKAAIEEYVAGIAAVLARCEGGAAAGRSGLHRRQRPARALSRDPRAGRPAARRAARAARQPAHGPARRRVLRVDPHLPLTPHQPGYGALPAVDLVPVVAVVDDLAVAVERGAKSRPRA